MLLFKKMNNIQYTCTGKKLTVHSMDIVWIFIGAEWILIFNNNCIFPHNGKFLKNPCILTNCPFYSIHTKEDICIQCILKLFSGAICNLNHGQTSAHVQVVWKDRSSVLPLPL